MGRLGLVNLLDCIRSWNFIFKDFRMKHQAIIRGKLREAARYIPEKQAALLLAESNTKGIRGGRMYDCNHCCKTFSPRDVQVDHIIPVIPLDREIEDWNEYIRRLFCNVENLQVLCKPCHLIKSNYENKKRKLNQI